MSLFLGCCLKKSSPLRDLKFDGIVDSPAGHGGASESAACVGESSAQLRARGLRQKRHGWKIGRSIQLSSWHHKNLWGLEKPPSNRCIVYCRDSEPRCETTHDCHLTVGNPTVPVPNPVGKKTRGFRWENVETSVCTFGILLKSFKFCDPMGQ